MPEPVPILYTIPNFITAGSGRAMLNIIQRLDRSRFAPSICVFKRGGDLELEVERLGIPLLETPFAIRPTPYSSLFRRARAASRPLRPGRFVFWHSFNYSDDYTEPIIARMAGARAWIFTKKNMSWRGRAWRLRTFLATRVLAQNTDMLRDFFASPLFHHKVRLVPRGVETGKFSPEIPPHLNLRQQLNIPPEAVTVGCVAHLVPVKGHPTLLQAAASIPEIHLLIAGKPLDAEYASGLEELARSLGMRDRVHFLGGVKDIPGLLSELDIFVLPTWGKWRMEGCPVALLEAMSSGRACIATAIPGSRDLVVSGCDGLIVPPEDGAALSAALGQLAGSPELRNRLGTCARESVLKNFSIEKETLAHVEIYEEVLAKIGF